MTKLKRNVITSHIYSMAKKNKPQRPPGTTRNIKAKRKNNIKGNIIMMNHVDRDRSIFQARNTPLDPLIGPFDASLKDSTG